MTDKELRKLRRLELLELLLEASKENRELKESIERLKSENDTARNIENLSAATQQVENSLKYVNSLTDSLKNALNEAASPRVNVKANIAKETEIHTESAYLSDREIYRRMLCFFAENTDKLSVFPSDIENDVRARIRRILER